MTSQEQITDTEKVVTSYRPSSYAEMTWPTIEAPSSMASEGFTPAEFEQISESSFAVDPMFAEFDPEERNDASRHELFPSNAGDAQPETGMAVEINDESLEAPGRHDQLVASQSEFGDSSESISPNWSDEVGDSPTESHQDNDPTIAANGAADEAKLLQAQEEGYARGCAATRADVELHQRQLEERYTLLWEDMQTQLTETVLAHEQQAIELAFQIARRMVGAVVDSHKEYVVSVVKEALHAAGSSEVKVVRVSPQDFEFLQLGGYGERIKIHGDKKLVFESDEIIRSGCIVVTNAGEIDFDLDKAWTRMHEKTLQGPRS